MDCLKILCFSRQGIIDQVITFLPIPTQEDYREAHSFFDDGNIVGEKHPED